MPSTVRSFMTPQGYGNILKRFGKVVCHLCREPIAIRTPYVRKKTTGQSRAKQYHVSCAEKVNLI